MNKIFQLLLDNSKREKQSSGLIKNESGATIYIYDVIDSYWGVGAKSVISALAEIGDETDVAVRLNSPGGDVFEGRAIMAAIRNHKGKTTCYIDSLAASAATSIALACDEVVIAKGAFFMIHNASSAVWGDKNAMRDTADLLEKIEGSIVDDYIGKTGAEHQQIVDWMNAETWFSADEAIANGFCDRLAETAKAKNTWNLSAFGNAPAALLRNESDDTADLSEQEKKFLQDMIHHHEMAIEMARAILPNAASEKVRGLAEAIIAAQAGEIALIETWLADTAAPENKKKPMKPMKMQTDDPATKQNEEPAPAGFFMSAANANRLKLAMI